MWEFILQQLNNNPNSIIFDSDRIFTYNEFKNIIASHGENLKKHLPFGAKCAVLCKSGLNCAISILACWYANIIPIPMSMNYGEHHCRNILDFTTPDMLITDDEMYPDFNKYNLLSCDFSLCNKQNIYKDNDLEDVAAIMCTSGTTGIPKGTLITIKGLHENIIKISKYFDINTNDKIMIARPLYHCAVFTGEFLVSIFKGVNIGFFDGKYDPNNILQFAIKEDITVLCGTPTLFNHISGFVKRAKLIHKIKKIALSGECLNRKTAEIIRGSFPYSDIYNVYGLTEASPRVSFLSPELFDNFSESVGLPLDGIEIIISDSGNNELPAYSKGMIMIKTPCIMKGYYKNKAATDKSIINGWLNTGDYGYKDENGYLYILSRVDDMIIKGGMNIYPKEIENQVISIEVIKECMAYGIKTDIGQEIAIDIVLNTEEKTVSKRDLVGLISDTLPSYQMPTKINIVNSLKRNASGKLVRSYSK